MRWQRSISVSRWACSPASWWWCFLLLAFWPVAAQEAPPQTPHGVPGSTRYSASSTDQKPSTSATWETFDALWSSLKTELVASQSDWEMLLAELRQLSTEASELRSSLTASRLSLQRSEEARVATDQARTEAERIMQRRIDDLTGEVRAVEDSRDWWRAFGLIAAGAAGIGWIIAAIGIIF